MKLNPELEVGDRIVVLLMQDETSSVPLLTKGEVVRINQTPFGLQYSVKWDNGSKLDLIPEIDKYVKADEYESAKTRRKPIGESLDMDWFIKNKEVRNNFDTNKIVRYLKLIKESGIENMFGAAKFLYIGSQMLERLYPEPPNEDAFMEAVEMADEVKDELVRGTVKYLESKNEEITVEKVSRQANKFAQKLLEYWIKTHG